MVQHHRALAVIARPTGERLHILFKLLDQALLVRGDNIHSPSLAAQQLKSGYSERGAILLVAGKTEPACSAVNERNDISLIEMHNSNPANH